jgi:beta-galactosidase
MKLKTLVFSTVVALAAVGQACAQSAEGRKDWPGQGQLFIGANYQPVDRSPDQIRKDIALMKATGLSVIRMGDLSWDYFEPADGVFTFKEFDAVMDQMHAAGIKVILDIPGLPAPIWLHQKYPGVDIVAQNGSTLYPATRYMDDISDPDYQRLARRLGDALTKHYARHPALLAVGYDNEIGASFMSFSEPVRQRFIGWLEKRYGDLPALNKAWATQRWSRRISDWNQVRLPYFDGPGPNERNLDLRRFWSDVTISVLKDLEAIRKKNVPDKPAISNLYDVHSNKGFDYLATHRQYVSYGAFGFYHTEAIPGAFETLAIKGALPAPVWFNEFQAGGFASHGIKGKSRMWAYFGLINGGQAALAWTFNTHRGGEEQAFWGLLDHDNTPSWRLSEWGTMAAEFKKIQGLGFPRQLNPEIAMSYSFESRAASAPKIPGNGVKKYYSTPYNDQKHNAFGPLYQDNLDVAVINIGHENLSRYKLLVVAGEYLMDQAATDAVRRYVSDGGTVIMTAFSDKVDETAQWYDTPLPGRLADVFGLKTKEFYQHKEPLTGTINGAEFKTSINFYEVLEPSTARVLARFSNLEGAPPVVTVNIFGKGKAIYVATPAQPSIMAPVYRGLYAELGIVPGPKTPDGVFARAVDGRVLYVNTTTEAKDIPLSGQKTGVLSGTSWNGNLRLGPYGVDLVQ